MKAQKKVRRVRRRLRRGRIGRVVRATRTVGFGELLRRPRSTISAVIAGTSQIPTDELVRRAREARHFGNPSQAHHWWLALAAREWEGAAAQLRMIEGILTETSTSWRPTVTGPREAVVPVSPRRILHIAKASVPDRWSGFTIRTHNNLLAQRAAGLDPVVVTEIGWPRTVGLTEFEPLVTVDGIPHYRLDRGPDYDPRRLPNHERLQDLVDDLAPLVQEIRPAILHAHSGYRGGEHALAALALREAFGIPVVYEVRGLFEGVWTSDWQRAERSELFARRLAQETRLLNEVDGILAISQSLIDDFVARGIPPSKIRLLPNGVDPSAFATPVRDPELRARLGLAGRFVVGYVGNLDHAREGIDVLLAALRELHRRGRTQAAVLVVGEGHRRAALEDEAARLGVAAHAVFTGRVPYDVVPSYYAQIDLFATPRVEERAARYITPLKPFEAMALERPILVSELPALLEIVDPPHRGLAAPPGDPIALARVIERAMDDEGLRRRIAANGRDWVLKERTWAANGPRYREAYEAILGSLD